MGGSESVGSVGLTMVRLSQSDFPIREGIVIKGPPLYPDGIIGSSLLMNLAGVAFDYERRLLYFIPRPRMGLDLDPEQEGVVVRTLSADSSAKSAGVQVGDHLLKLEDQTLDSIQTLQQVVRNRTVGETVTLSVQRGDRTLALRVTLAPSFR